MPHLISLNHETSLPKAKHRRLLASGPGWKLLLLDLRQGGEVAEHSAPGPITVHLLEGHADFAIAGEWRPLEAGEIQCLEAKVPHAVRAPDGALLLVHVMG